MHVPLISIVVIGRNEAKNLPRLHASLAPLLERWPSEVIFVDSASRDNSVDIARGLFNKTAVLDDSANLNASAGRHIGVGLASGQWVLFMDGDMTLATGSLGAVARHVEQGPRDCGLVGNYVNRFPDGSTRRWIPSTDRHGLVIHFGGAVILPMAALRKENWDPRLFSNEEVELYTRLRSQHFGVIPMGEDFVDHWTLRVPPWKQLIGNFSPRGSFLGKKFFGVGQVLAARVGSGRIWSLVRWFPEPFALWLSIAMLPVLVALFGWLTAFGALMVVTGAIVWRRNWRMVVVYIAFLPQAVFGWRRFASDWTPAVKAVYERQPPAGS